MSLRLVYKPPEYILANAHFMGLLRKVVCKAVYRSKGRGRGKRIKWVKR